MSTESTATTASESRKTPLYDAHLAANGKIVPFAGYLLPVEYPAGIVAEHEAVRTSCGLFDVSHMGELMVEGPRAAEALDAIMTNVVSTMQAGACRYTVMCYEDGGAVDDLIVYRLGDEKFLIVANAANKDKDAAWIAEHLGEGAAMTDESDDTAQIAVQGPRAAEIMARVSDEALLPQKNYTFTERMDVAGAACLVSRTGYTGEDGFEVYCAPADARTVWDALLSAGGDAVMPCGLGARDTLRLEASMPLYGHELSADIDPIEAGLGFFVKLDKPAFIGRDALAAKKEAGGGRRRIGIEVVGRGIVREGAPLFAGGRQIGETTSGTFCPHLKKACAMALVEAGSVEAGDEVEAEVRGRRIAARVVALPFYRRPKNA